jgi:hypothetical protein
VLRFIFSLAAASLIAVSGYSAMGLATHTSARPGLKVIAVVVAHPHHRAAVSSAARSADLPILQ